MSAIEDVLKAIDAAIEHLGEAQASITTAVSEVDDGLSQAVAFGVTASIEGMSQAKEQLEAAVEQIAATTGSVEEARGSAQAVADST